MYHGLIWEWGKAEEVDNDMYHRDGAFFTMREDEKRLEEGKGRRTWADE
jgi:hypothetical protein